MKSLFFLLAFCTLFPLKAALQYEFDPGVPGHRDGALKILENLSSLTLRTNFGSVGNSGAIGYYVYTTDPAQAIVGAATFRKHDGAISLPELNAGDKVGFFLVRNNGMVVRRFNFIASGDSYFLIFHKNAGGQDERMFFSSIAAEGAATSSGQPLPGLLITIALGVLVLFVIGMRSGVRETARC